ncbi:hypothetical protein COMA2_120077 [Candidatus Nitrospira nitrificans]|uniref:Uncharacterized protein n=1 Tax=Candidatus Nitrospira nitrificans TaxID=1742973 RepID=A0A0S4L8L4_9BACT|nr:hypothetical protein COMA2_120077 [Candidatus Nitrospira nitrificans]
MLAHLSSNQIKFSRPLLGSKLDRIRQQIRADLEGEQLGFL